MPGQSRPREIRRRRRRHKKLSKLRARHSTAKTESERTKILDKISRVAPFLRPAEFIAAAKKA